MGDATVPMGSVDIALKVVLSLIKPASGGFPVVQRHLQIHGDSILFLRFVHKKERHPGRYCFSIHSVENMNRQLFPCRPSLHSINIGSAYFWLNISEISRVPCFNFPLCCLHGSPVCPMSGKHSKVKNLEISVIPLRIFITATDIRVNTGLQQKHWQNLARWYPM